MNENIEDYALIGDLETAAMIGRDGSIDWLCLPRFDSPACFAALLGTGENGFWRVSPAGAGLCTHRAYRAGTLVLDTVWDTPSGTVRVTDFMPPRAVSPCIVRMVEGLSGSVPMRSELKPRFHQGRVVPWVRTSERFTVATAGPDSTWLGTDSPVQVSGGPGLTVGDFTVSAGRQVTLQLVWAPSHLLDVPSALLTPAATMLAQTTGFWRRWVSRCQYQGPWRDSVVRSLITLKALIYAPTGSVVAAPTTSLPEQLGGERNWDYRHCWLRDSTLALSCLLRSGYREEATAWLDWLLRATAGGLSGLQSVYGLGGERLLPETEAPWLPGYEGSRPVRFGNAAVEQYQLDVYGEVLDTLYWSLRSGVSLQPRIWSLVKVLMGYLLVHWRDPDQGLWEVRGPRRHFVHSKVMSWVAADRALRMGEMLGRNGTSKEWRAMKDTVHREVCREGWDGGRGSFVQAYGGTALDASALLIPGLGFLPAGDARVRGTVRAMRALDRDGFLYRYRHTGAGVDRVDGMPGSECPFVACSLWYADALAATGDLDEAQTVFERVLGVRNDVGLLSEQWDPAGRRQLGNAPQAFSHISLVETAFAMQRASNGHTGRDVDERSPLRTAVSSSMPESP
ncbi:glycoside hydrolase family 15 protein [Streptomyces sp. NPDC001741]|uniref:glycoside hydrolase family 15 protein n=1 Tax=unclassified Streptomyces TaxID=2593676 RepID=UPI0036825D7F